MGGRNCMKILIVCHGFPPFNSPGAVRAGKTAKYLMQMGHQVKVISADNQVWMPNLPVEIEEVNIIRTAWFNVNKPIQLLLGGKKNIAAKGFESAKRLPRVIKTMGYFYKDLINFPDGQIGWYPFAMRAGKKLLKKWKPDFILGSAEPATSLLIARKLAKTYGIPWVADLRDLWADHHNAIFYRSAVRRWVDQKIEKWTLSTADGLVTVSEPLAGILRNKFTQPVAVVLNGYDLEDYPSRDVVGMSNIPVKIVYTGIVHPKKADPRPLFQALSLLGEDAKKIAVNFYGRNNESIKKIAIEYGIDGLVNCYNTVPYCDSLQYQINADILLLLIHNSKAGVGVFSAKFFEYMGARRPILLLGCMDGVAADIIKERGLGFAENDPYKIVDILRSCIANKEGGKVTETPFEAIHGFSRKEQTQELIKFLNEMKGKRGGEI